MIFDITKLVSDLGGPAAVAELVGVSRTTPYRWIKAGQVSTRVLARIRGATGKGFDGYFRDA